MAAAILLLMISSILIWKLIPNNNNHSELSNHTQTDTSAQDHPSSNKILIDSHHSEKNNENKLDKAPILSSETKAIKKEEEEINLDTPISEAIALQQNQPPNVSPEPVAIIELDEEVVEEIFFETTEISDTDDYEAENDLILDESLAFSLDQKKVASDKLIETQAKKEKETGIQEEAKRRKPFSSNGRANSQDGQNNELSRNYSFGFINLVQPSPENGEAAFKKYLSKNGIRLKGRKNHSAVTLTFEVGSDGSPQNILLIKGDSTIGQIVIPILQKGPKWTFSPDTTLNIVTKEFFKKQ